MLLKYGLAYLAAAVSFSCALPNAAPQDQPGLPTLQQIKDQLTQESDTYLFYSGPGSFAKKAHNWAKARGNGYKVLRELWIDPQWPNQFQRTAEQSEEFFGLASQAMAELAQGLVYVMLPADTRSVKWEAGTVWAQKEWPNLPRDVVIIRVNPVNDEQEQIQGREGAWTVDLFDANSNCQGPALSRTNGNGSSGCFSAGGNILSTDTPGMAKNCVVYYYGDLNCVQALNQRDWQLVGQCTSLTALTINSFNVVCPFT